MNLKILKFLFILVSLALFAPRHTKALMNPVLKVESSDAEKHCLYAGEVYQQKFTSPVDSFGIIAVQFTNNNRINDDTIQFRIRSAEPSPDPARGEASSDWYYQAETSAEQFRSGWYFPFGFPPIENAENKDFIFEIESTRGEEDNCVSVFIDLDTGDINSYVANEVPAKKFITTDIQRKFKEDKIFFIGWVILVLLITGYLIRFKIRDNENTY